MESLPQFETQNQALLVRAPAKINLSLLVGQKRPDGYHEIETLMARVSLYDDVRIEPAQGGIALSCIGDYPAPEGPENLVYRAAQAFFDHTGIAPAVRISLHKRIPVGAGLGGGSSDAAAVLMGLNRFFAAGLGEAELMTLGAALGSDVPFFIGPPLAFCTGRGEKIQKIFADFSFAALLFVPPVSAATKVVYGHFRPDMAFFRKCSYKISELLRENKVDFIAQICANMLRNPCLGAYPLLRDAEDRIKALNLGQVCLSGSGSCFYCLLRCEDSMTLSSPELERKTGCRSIKVVNNRW